MFVCFLSGWRNYFRCFVCKVVLEGLFLNIFRGICIDVLIIDFDLFIRLDKMDSRVVDRDYLNIRIYI